MLLLFFLHKRWLSHRKISFWKNSFQDEDIQELCFQCLWLDGDFGEWWRRHTYLSVFVAWLTNVNSELVLWYWSIGVNTVTEFNFIVQRYIQKDTDRHWWYNNGKDRHELLFTMFFTDKVGMMHIQVCCTDRDYSWNSAKHSFIFKNLFPN